MITLHPVDGVLVQWGDRLFFPGNRRVKVAPTPRLCPSSLRRRAAAVRRRIVAAFASRAPQVIVKVTGGGRGMQAIKAHFRYISKNGRLVIEDERGQTIQGRDAVYLLGEEWRYGGSLIDEVGCRREAFNIMLSMPRGTNPLIVQRAASEFAQTELAGHKYVMVLHDHQANPHVHISVRAESQSGKRLNPRRADLHRWRETFAEKLRGWGIEAEATRQRHRGERFRSEPLWRLKAEADGRLRVPRIHAAERPSAVVIRNNNLEAWQHIGEALARSEVPGDLHLGRLVARHVQEMGREAMDAAANRQPTAAQPAVNRIEPSR